MNATRGPEPIEGRTTYCNIVFHCFPRLGPLPFLPMIVDRASVYCFPLAVTVFRCLLSIQRPIRNNKSSEKRRVQNPAQNQQMLTIPAQKGNSAAGGMVAATRVAP